MSVKKLPAGSETSPGRANSLLFYRSGLNPGNLVGKRPPDPGKVPGFGAISAGETAISGGKGVAAFHQAACCEHEPRT
ncbi:hypothetical protein C7S18_02515 [Ahniella affigens]|uniref:Uncharacterized protein n=1 Tax=Ahniella affigens TaxID=2021234 RepID=A0A2P1PMR1_9GAMM|nr:hypothetical protein C7S18_02515 [Ahniella affigens]